MQEASGPRSRWDSRWLGPTVVVAAVLAIYLHGALRSGFAYDDARFIVENPHVLRPRGTQGWFALLTDPTTTDPNAPGGIVRPFRTLLFALDHALFRLDPQAFHLHSLAWFAAAGIGCLALLRRLVGSGVAPILGALIWVAHPMQVEAAAWISSRGDVAMAALMFFGLCALLDGRTWLAMLLGLVAMGFKETAVVLPLLVFAVRLVRPAGDARGALPAARAAAPFLLVSAAYLVFRSVVQVGDTAHVNTFVLGGSTAGTFATMFRALGAYLWMLVAPVRPAVDWYMVPSTTLADAASLGWLVVHVGVIGTAITQRIKRPRLAAAICFVYFPLIPVANWPFPIGIPTTERFLHLSITGVALLAAAGAHRLPRARPALALGVLALGAVSIERVPDWRDNDALFAAEEWHGHSPRTESYMTARERELGLSLRRKGQDAEADRAFEAALEHAHQALDRWRRFESVSYSTSDVVVHPHVNASNLCILLDQWGHALWHADRALAAGGGRFPETQYNRGIALQELGRPLAALNAFESAIEDGFSVDEPLAKRLTEIGDELVALGYATRAQAAYEAAGTELDAPGLARLRAVIAQQNLVQVSPRETWDLEHVRLGLFALGTADGWNAAFERLTELLALESEQPTELPTDLVRRRFEQSARVAQILFLLARCDEELGRDHEALTTFLTLRRSGPVHHVPGMELDLQLLSAAQRAYWMNAVERIESGCPAWRDHGRR